MKWPVWIYRLDDHGDPWFSDDKIFHLFGGAVALMKSRDLLTRWGCAEWAVLFWSATAVVFAALLVEFIECVRWEAWQERKAPQPQPWMCDKVSIKDILAGLLGAWMATW